jgi:sialate O-acetylesterase
VPEFSAACYYFARELQKTIDVPMGLINSSWGGARIETWISDGFLRRLGGYDEALDVLAQYATDRAAATASWGEVWARWWRERPGAKPGDEPWRADYVPGNDWRVGDLGRAGAHFVQRHAVVSHGTQAER